MSVDYGREIAFGVFPSPDAGVEALRRTWAVIEAADSLLAEMELIRLEWADQRSVRFEGEH
ncbi:hypothetical protein [Nocardiopsis valliformis]|uniref:hypothetical protein n=1 Tax=Nocardiopsis valliformis TaxID=239974 RepID=UPI00034D91EA|nr:hypothetical protein [Nocardiopsis valliformis]